MKTIRKLSDCIGLLAVILLLALSSSITALAQCDTCAQGLGEQAQVFGTNCSGGLVANLAHPGDTVGIQIKGQFINECALQPCLQGDQSVITNINFSVNNPCATFTSANLLTTNLAPPIPDAAHIQGGKNPIFDIAYPAPNAGGQRIANFINVSSGQFAGSPVVATFVVPSTCRTSIVFSTRIQGFNTNNSLGKNNGLQQNAAQDVSVRLITPKLCVSKSCTTNGLTGENEVILWSGSVSNCGDSLVSGISVRNHFNVVPPGHTQDEIVIANFSLSPNQVTNFAGSYSPVCVTSNDVLTALGVDELQCPVSASASATCVPHCAPLIKVWKQVVCLAAGGCEAFDPNLNNQKSATGVRVDPPNDNNCPAFCYRIAVTNTGNVTLSSVTVVDVANDGHSLNLTSCGFPSVLAPGAGAVCIVSTNHCVTAQNIVTASGVGEVTGGGTATVSSRDTNNVTVIPIAVQCRLLVSTNNGGSFFEYHSPNCASAQIGNDYIVRIVVTNAGQWPLQNVIITNTGATPLCFTSPRNIGSLPLNGTFTLDCTNHCTTPICPNNFAIAVVADASQTPTHVCDFNRLGQRIEAHANCDTCVCCVGCPSLRVTKGVACVVCTTTPNGVVLGCASFNGQFNKDAFGIRSDTQEPAFCYEIAVTNNGGVPLVSLTVSDNRFGVLTNNATLGVNGLMVFRLTTNWANLAPQAGQSYNVTNTVTATSTSSTYIGCPNVDSGGSISASDFAIAHIRPLEITCEKLVSVNGGIPTDSFSGTDVILTNIIWYAVVHNTGQADATNIVITESSNGDDLPCTVNVTIPRLDAGNSTGLVPLCTNAYGFGVCTNISIHNFIQVVAEAAAEGTNCVWDINGSNIVAKTTCDAVVNITCTTPTSCRVTGGGRIDDPLVCPANVRYITHGGQVGAPVGNMICVVQAPFYLGNPCIHGRWTHVRHTQGGLEGNFHARFYDTLDCSCLLTTFDSSGCYDLGTVDGGRCNPGDRVAGPEPRKAPANKIVFTGVGDWADPNGRRESRATLFRVDIEDRSEPGGSHPGGATPPADRYRIRIWVLTTTELAELDGAGPDPYLFNFRTAISSCHGINYRDGVTTPYFPNVCGTSGTIVFGGPCDSAGAPVRKPDIDDGGETLHGNLQIHPQIKDCDPNNPTGPGLAKP